MKSIPNELIFFDEAKKIYREQASYLKEVIDDVSGKAKYNQVKG